MIDTVVIYNGPDICQTCLGWKCVDDGEGCSWKYWAELTPPSNIAVVAGLVQSVECPDCKGTGASLTP